MSAYKHVTEVDVEETLSVRVTQTQMWSPSRPEMFREICNMLDCIVEVLHARYPNSDYLNRWGWVAVRGDNNVRVALFKGKTTNQFFQSLAKRPEVVAAFRKWFRALGEDAKNLETLVCSVFDDQFWEEAPSYQALDLIESFDKHCGDLSVFVKKRQQYESWQRKLKQQGEVEELSRHMKYLQLRGYTVLPPV